MHDTEGSPSVPPDAPAPDTLGPTTTIRPPPMPHEAERGARRSLPSLSDVRRSLTSLPDVRRSLLSILPPAWNPRWAPWSPARVARAAVSFAAVTALLVVLTHRVTGRWVMPVPLQRAAAVADEPIVSPSPVAPPGADAALAREHRSPVAGGLLAIPPGFHSRDGAYDLVIHFHGNTDLVEESFFASGIDAVIVIMNLGNGSGPYEDRFANPASLPEVLERVETTMQKRGLAGAHLRRLALTAWSAGYGAVLEVLAQPALARKVDAVILLDGIHVGYQPGGLELYLERLLPFERFAREAAAGDKLFSITHSNITPIGHYAGTRETTDALLRALDIPRAPGGDAPAMPALRSIDGVIAKKRLWPLVPETFAVQGGLRVRGFAGDQPEHHLAHLVHMSTTALPDLVAWWTTPAPR